MNVIEHNYLYYTKLKAISDSILLIYFDMYLFTNTYHIFKYINSVIERSKKLFLRTIDKFVNCDR